MKKIIFLLTIMSLQATASTGAGNGPDLTGVTIPLQADKAVRLSVIKDIEVKCASKYLQQFVYQITGKPCVPQHIRTIGGEDVIGACKLNPMVHNVEAVTLEWWGTIVDADDTRSLGVLRLQYDPAVTAVSTFLYPYSVGATDNNVYPSIRYTSAERIADYDVFGRVIKLDSLVKGISIMAPEAGTKVYYKNNSTNGSMTNILADVDSVTACLVEGLNRLP